MERLCVQGKLNSLVKVKGEGIFNSVKVKSDVVIQENIVNNKQGECLISENHDKHKETQLENLPETTKEEREEINKNNKEKSEERGAELLSKMTIDVNEKYFQNAKYRNICVLDKEGKEKNITIITINLGWKKQWYGGFKNVRNQKIYWNTYTQTVITGRGKRISWPMQEKLTVTRDTQTHLDYKTRGVNTTYVKETQTPLIFEEPYQSIIIPFKYIPKEEVEIKRNKVKNAILVIQKWVKRYLAMKEFRRQKAIEEKMKIINEKRKKEKDKEVNIPERVQLSIKPAVSSKAQLYSLEKDVIKWKEKELEKILLTKSGPAKYAALYELLDKEIKYLYQYESVRIKLKEEKALSRKEQFLQTIGSSTSRKAKDLKDLYELYIYTTNDHERLKAIITVITKIDKQYIDYEWAFDLKELLTREMAMMKAGYTNLRNLQIRIETLLFDLISCPEFNPLADKYIKTIQPFHKKKERVSRKTTSPAYDQPSSEYISKASSWLENIGKISINLTPYSVILKELRNHEKELTTNSWACWKINAIDMYYLVNIIWNGRSILTEITDIDRLRTVRWDNSQEWSPWNCILLTEEEALLQAEIINLDDTYDETLIKRVNIKHLLAKMRYNKLYKLYIETVIADGEENIKYSEEK